MKLFYRILLAVDAVFLSVVSVFMMVAVLRKDLLQNLSDYMNKHFLTDKFSSLSVFIIAFIFFCINLSFLLSGLRTNKEKRAIAKHTNIGQIKISLNSIESIVLLTAKKINSVRDSKVRVGIKNEGVVIDIKTVVLPEIDIPLLAEELQSKVKKAVEESTGIMVYDIEVIVENIYTGYRSRVE
ncbi:MAG: alkaline shock response membrane anchor protein AmaP [Clostridiales bacterium]